MAKRASQVAAAAAILKQRFRKIIYGQNTLTNKNEVCVEMKMKMKRLFYGEESLKQQQPLQVKDVQREKKDGKNAQNEKKDGENVQKYEKLGKDQLDFLSKLLILQGMGDLTIKSSAGLISALQKGPKEASTELFKSMTGMDVKEQITNVTKVLALCGGIEQKLNELSAKIDSLSTKVDGISSKVETLRVPPPHSLLRAPPPHLDSDSVSAPPQPSFDDAEIGGNGGGD